MSPDISYLFLAVACTNAAIGAFVLLNDVYAGVKRAFFLFCAGAALWIGGFGLLLLTRNLAFIPVLNIGGLTIVIGLFWFANMFPARPMPRARIIWFLPLLAAAWVAAYPGLLIEHVEFVGSSAVPQQGPLFPLYAACLTAYALTSVALLLRSYRTARRAERVRFQYFFLGLLIFVCASIMGDLMLPALGIFEANFIGPVASVFSIAATAYAVLRHQLMDIRIVLQRGLIYSVLLAVIIAAYVAIVHTVGLLFGESNDAVLLSAFITTLLGIFGAPIIEKYFGAATNRIFFKDRYDYASTLHALSEALHHNVEFDAMVASSKVVLEHALHPERIEIMDSGEVVLGPKRSGDPYTIEDKRLIETFSHQAAIAFERARLYDEVKHHAASLESEVEERTRELLIARDMQRQMMVDISHNLQTPLTIFQTKLERLRQTLPEREVRSLETSLSNLSAFIYDLLKFAKLDRETDAAHEPIDLSAIVEEIAEEIEIIALEHGISVRSNIEQHVCISGDAHNLREAFLNVASNAIKYMRKSGKKEIVFTLAREGQFAIATVRDSGLGLRQDELERIFERFYRARTGEEVSGSGLGLAIVKRIVEAHGGTITAHSEVGHYMEIRIRFPTMESLVEPTD